MKSRVNALLLFLITAATMLQFSDGLPDGRAPLPSDSSATTAQLREAFGKLPLYFIENRGQLDSRVAYYIHGGNQSIYFGAGGVTIALSDTRGNGPLVETSLRPASFDQNPFAPDIASQRRVQRWVLKLDFVDANLDARPEALDPTDAIFSYYTGDHYEWRTNISTYATLLYRNLWPGIDLHYTGADGRLKYTFFVHPGADPGRIRLAYRGATAVQINNAGQLEVDTPLQSFREDSPYAYQAVKGERLEITAAYELISDASDGIQFGFRVEDYDRNRELVLDPVVLLYAGYIASEGDERGHSIAVDSEGNAYVTGRTNTFDTPFPATVGPDLTFNGSGDAFVAKINPSGSGLVYAGFIGGENDDAGNGIAVDSEGNAYVVGESSSSEDDGFPVLVGPDLTFNGDPATFDNDVFVAKVSADGTALVYSGYIGGSRNDHGNGIALDSSGSAYVTGRTSSTEDDGFPVLVGPDLTFNGNPAMFDSDAFVAKVNAAGSALVYAGYVGGSGGDEGYGIAVGSDGAAYITGYTGSDEGTFPVAVGPDLSFNGNPAMFDSDAFVAKVNAAGSALDYAGYIGGSSRDEGRGIVVDSAGSAYVTGQTGSGEASFPVEVGPDLTFNGDTDAFVAKVHSSGASLVYSGYIGGSARDEGYGIAVNSSGSAFITGGTESTEDEFPVGIGPDLTANGNDDAFVAKVSASGGGLDFAGFIGGSENDTGLGIAIDSAGNSYISGQTLSAEAGFPVTVGPDLTFPGEDFAAFVAKISPAEDFIRRRRSQLVSH